MENSSGPLPVSKVWIRQALGRATAAKTKRPGWCPHEPTERQSAFLELDCLEALYGGAAGGGKSDGILMAALQYVDVPRYGALILRRTTSDLALEDAIMDRAKRWLIGSGATWNGKDKKFTFPSSATLTFGYLEHEFDKYRYQSAAFQFIGFDELTQFLLSQYTYMFSRLRRLVGVDIPLRMRSGTNPGGVGHEWVKARFIDQETREGDAVFVPAKLADNPHLDQVSYRSNLAKLDPVTRKQLEDGDWDALGPGQYFGREWFTISDYVPPKFHMRLVRYWDMAASEEPRPGSSKDPDYTASCLFGEDNQHPGVYYVLDVTCDRWPASELEKNVRAQADEDGPTVRIVMEQEGGSSGEIAILAFQRALSGFAFEGKRSTGSKIERAKPASAMAFNRKIFLQRGEWNSRFLGQLHNFPTGKHDDMVDAFSGALNVICEHGGLSEHAATPTESTRPELFQMPRRGGLWGR